MKNQPESSEIPAHGSGADLIDLMLRDESGHTVTYSLTIEQAASMRDFLSRAIAKKANQQYSWPVRH